MHISMCTYVCVYIYIDTDMKRKHSKTGCLYKEINKWQ